jgi:hypothetical protein
LLHKVNHNGALKPAENGKISMNKDRLHRVSFIALASARLLGALWLEYLQKHAGVQAT